MTKILILIFFLTSTEFLQFVNFQLFQVNIHEIDENSKINEKYLATGYFKVNKSLIDNSLLEIDMSLLSSNQIVGSLKGISIIFHLILFV